MRRDEVEKIVQERPFRPFEIRLVDGERWNFSSPEQYVLTKGTIKAQDRKGWTHYLDLNLILKITIMNDGIGRS